MDKIFAKDGKCSRCGQCCSAHIPITDKDISRIKSYVLENHVKPIVHCESTNQIFLDLLCPFLKQNKDGTSECTIYEIRPGICKLYQCDTNPIDYLGVANDFIMAGKETNLQQIFFPGKFIPDTGDIVYDYNEIVNHNYDNTQCSAYIVTSNQRTVNGVVEREVVAIPALYKVWKPVEMLHSLAANVEN